MRGRARGVTGNRRVAIDQGWQIASAPAGSHADPSRVAELTWIAASVPGTAASALRAAGLWSWDDQRAFDAEDWWWRTQLPVEAQSASPRTPVAIGFDGVATLWDAWIDGEWVAHGDGMFTAREIELRTPGRELVIRCRSLTAELANKRPRPRWKVPMLEQQQLRWFRTTLLGRTPGWSPPCPAVGPWRPVWLEQRALAVGEVALDVRVVGDAGFVQVGAQLGDADGATLVLAHGDQRVTLPLALEAGAWVGNTRVADPVLWWPHTHGSPARYAASIIATRKGETFTIDLGHTGFRAIELDRGAQGDDFAISVNGVPIFCRGACWTPLDPVSLGASPSAYDAAVRQMVDAGMNMLRIGGTMVYEDAALHDALDEHGVLLWQDLMFANMDYPDDAELTRAIEIEVDQQLARLQARPALAIVCGNSEGEQQAAMWGAERARWSPPLFHEVIPRVIERRMPGTAYVPSSAHRGAFPHASNAGPSSYYGVGAYLRPLEDARRSEVRFASECLAFANIPAASGLPGGAALRVHHPAWKARSPRDLGAGWDFDDVRDQYMQRLYGIDPVALRVADHERYLALGRAATGEVMAQTFSEWRRARSVCRGALVWFLRDLWPGAGWGLVDAHGAAKPCWYPVRRALQPTGLAFSDEGTNGLVLHVCDEHAASLPMRLDVTLWRAGEIAVGRGGVDIDLAPRSAREVPVASLFDGFLDLSFAYRFGPPVAHVIHAELSTRSDGNPVAHAYWFPAGLPATREVDIGLTARAKMLNADVAELAITTKRFAQTVAIEAPGFAPHDDYFHLAPGQTRTIALRRVAAGALRGHVYALNAETGAKIEL